MFSSKLVLAKNVENMRIHLAWTWYLCRSVENSCAFSAYLKNLIVHLSQQQLKCFRALFGVFLQLGGDWCHFLGPWLGRSNLCYILVLLFSISFSFPLIVLVFFIFYRDVFVFYFSCYFVLYMFYWLFDTFYATYQLLIMYFGL